MELEITSSLEGIEKAFGDRSSLPTSFIGSSDQLLEDVCSVALELTVVLWKMFKSMNMFDIYATGNLTFPIVLSGVVGTNLILVKDNTISSNEINIFVKQF